MNLKYLILEGFLEIRQNVDSSGKITSIEIINNGPLGLFIPIDEILNIPPKK